MWLVKPGIAIALLYFFTRNTSAASSAASSWPGGNPGKLWCSFLSTFGTPRVWVDDPDNKYAASAGRGGYCGVRGSVEITDTPGVDGPITSPSQLG